jgi:hypothetical protein
MEVGVLPELDPVAFGQDRGEKLSLKEKTAVEPSVALEASGDTLRRPFLQWKSVSCPRGR